MPIIPNLEAPEKPTTHSQIKKILDDVKVKTFLTPPPKSYLATICKKGEARSASISFHHPTAKNDASISLPLVIYDLVELHLGEKVAAAHIIKSTFEHLLETQLSETHPSINIPGSAIKFQRRNQTYPETLSDDVSLQVFIKTPYIEDEDPDTVEKNRTEAKNALKTEIYWSNKAVEAAQQAKKLLENALEALT